MMSAPARPIARPVWRLPVALALVALFGCAPQAASDRQAGSPAVCTASADGFAPDRGLGGTGAPAKLADRGIGGTGAPVQLADRGIGGTGGPVSVKGTITGFASVCVNGLEIAYHADDSVDIDGVALPVAELRVGQVVSLRADAGTGMMRATDMAVRHAVSGPIDGVDNGGINLVVAGQTVLLAVGSPGADRLQVGQWVEVSGLRDPRGYIVAARVDLREPGQVVITGQVAGRPGALRIGGTRLAGTLPGSIGNTSVTVVGDYADRVLTVRDIIADDRAAGEMGMIYVEGIAKASQTASGAPAVQIGDDITAEIAQGFGTAPQTPTLMVLALHKSASGELTAVAHYDGSNSGASTTTTATTALAPHPTTTTAIATSTTASATARAASAAPAPAKAAVVTTSTSKAATTTVTATTSKGSTSSTSAASAAGKGGTASTGSSSSGSSSAGGGKGGSAGGSGAGGSAGGHGAAAPATK